ncbi:response regulator transcription factor [Cohnella candidum]|uniref:Helix-turn-helix domain-containing protein n=1 Tax=Cohnella candidum TaxID=2674991 RepID=A0A3G3K380_9BACL|nr:helix-turn-helix domain-containing protein [Cohnella candidum]AYQ74830.1 helix-turn-helix domain-containing protein [Cohnella candidum]
MREMLIVDDEKFAVEGIRNSNDWGRLGIDRVHVAYSADDARDILSERRIDVLICDIEMHDEDGLSLVRWVKQHSKSTEALFLTCHSEFEFAKEAIHLGSFDYLLKPVDGPELAEVITRMLKSIEEKEEQIRNTGMYRKYHALWNKQQPLLAERFWKDLLSRRILSFGDFLERALQDAQIELPSEHPVLPILISIEEWTKPLQERDHDIMEYAVKKAAEEIWLMEHAGHAVMEKNGELFVMVYASALDRPGAMSETWKQTGDRFIEFCEMYFYCRVSCYIGGFTPLQELPRMCDGLKRLERNNLTRSQSVFAYDEEETAVQSHAPTVNLDLSEWSKYMINGNREKFIEWIRQHADQWAADGDLHPKQLETYYHGLLQVIYHFLIVKGISVERVPNFALWSTAQIRTLPQWKNWAVNFVSAVMDAAYAEKETDGFVQKAIHFMKQHVEEDISREDVAAHVNLNPAYLSRLFKKETGTSLIDFLIETKMERGKQLLDMTDMTVSAIAMQVGYYNFSHFTKMFKKHFGVNPQDYRQRTRTKP